MITPEEYQALRDRLDGLRRERAQAEGALEEQLKRLREEFGVRDEAAAKKLLKKLEAALAAGEAEYRKLEAAYDREFGDKFSTGG